MPPLVSSHAAFDERPLGRDRRKAFIDQLHGQAGGPPERAREILRGFRLWASCAIEASGQADHDPVGFMGPCDIDQPRSKGVGGLRRNRHQRLRDRRRRIADRYADTLGPWIDRQDPHQGEGLGLGAVVAAAALDGVPGSTT